MARRRRCECCGQFLPEIRLGVRLSPLKARIFDIVQRAGSEGICGAALLARALPEESASSTLRTHIWQINEVLEDVGWRIGAGKWHGYRLRRVAP